MIRTSCNHSYRHYVINHDSPTVRRVACSLSSRHSRTNTRPSQPIYYFRFKSNVAYRDDSKDQTSSRELRDIYPVSSAFQYFPLPAQDGQAGERQIIRLLELISGHDSETVECNLRQFSLLDAPLYEALSYCWGDPNDRIIIMCNKKWLSVPRTLAGALRDVRSTDRSRILWADAICINQSDTSEKEHQVQIMRKIFSQSQGTLIWLGSPNEKNSGISLMARTAIRLGLAILRPRAGRSPQISLDHAKEMRSYNVSPFSFDFCIMLISMLRQPWFQRAWVVQEVATSRKATVIWGSVQCAWDDLMKGLDFMSKVNFPLAFLPALQHVRAIENERTRYKKGANSLLGLLLRQQRCITTDPRDKVYAFCGLMSTMASKRVDVSISYNDEVASIYRETAVEILKHDRSLDILSIPPSIAGSTSHELPSWAPDWSKSTSLDIAQWQGDGTLSLARKETVNKLGVDERRFAAAQDFECSLEFSASGHTLIVDGHIFDDVTEVGPVFQGVHLPRTVTNLRGIVKSYGLTIKSFLKTRHVLLHWEKLAKARLKSKYLTGENMLVAYWSTVSTGEFPNSQAVRLEIYLWDKINCFFPYFPNLWRPILDCFTLVYSAKVFLWYAISNKPLLKFEMQARYTMNRRLVRTKNGYIGLASGETRVGDSIALCKGSKVPLIIRAGDDSSSWRLIGDAYVHGIMHGEAFNESSCGKLSFV